MKQIEKCLESKIESFDRCLFDGLEKVLLIEKNQIYGRHSKKNTDSDLRY